MLIFDFLYNKKASKKEIAALSIVVEKAYKRGDLVAKKILLNAAKELFIMTDAVVKNLDFHKQSFYIVTNGSVINNNELINKEFTHMINEKYPTARVIKPLRDAAFGAVDIALSKIN